MRASSFLSSPAIAYVLAAGAIAWMLLLIVAPATLFPAGRHICHQRPDRSFFVNGQQMPVCARCTGLYAGAALASPLALFAASMLSRSRARRVLAAAALPTAITWTLEFTGVMPFSNLARFMAAVPLGFAAAWLVFAVTKGPRDQGPRDRMV